MDNWSRPLTTDEQGVVLNAFRSCDKLFAPHVKSKFSSAPLANTDAGSTIWLHPRDIDTHWVNYASTELITLINMLSNISKDELGSCYAGRSYIHRLLPGEVVDPHVDITDIKYFSNIRRFQIYLDIPVGAEITAGSIIKPNSILLFRHDILHAYKNCGNVPLYFIVFDLWPPFRDNKIPNI